MKQHFFMVISTDLLILFKEFVVFNAITKKYHDYQNAELLLVYLLYLGIPKSEFLPGSVNQWACTQVPGYFSQV